MCCFSGSIEHVAATKIFARGLATGEQVLIYSMELTAAGDLAMILPLPVPPRSPDNAVRFVSLEAYPEIFTHFDRAFPPPASFGPVSGGFAPQTLVVHEVGAYQASFVPTLADMERLDPRFRIANTTWEKLPGYRDAGFAVFQLKSRAKVRGSSVDYHPMAFVFPRRNRDSLFFPTLHIHDGEVHEEAAFDHKLYCQADDVLVQSLKYWWPSQEPASRYVDRERSAGLVDLGRPLHSLTLGGMHPNRDIVITPPSPPAVAA